jgi:hypothetical protein
MKREIHRSLGILAGVCCLYNTGAWLARGQTHSAINLVVYALIVALEREHVHHHHQACK